MKKEELRKILRGKCISDESCEAAISELLDLFNISGRTMSLDVAMATIKSMPYDQAKQVLLADLANKPDTVEIHGDIRLVYVR